MKIKNISEMQQAALKIKALGCLAVLIKGGHLNFSDGKIHSILLDEKNNFLARIGLKKIYPKYKSGTNYL